jgi:hypothetical protein
MNGRFDGSIAMLGAATPIVFATLALVACQARSATDAADAAAKTWSSPRTPWGEPDVQGIWTNTREFGTPFERPAEYEGKAEAELSQLLRAKQSQDETPEARKKRVEFADDPGDTGTGNGPVVWYEHLNPNNSRLWWLVDPPDGKMPALTPEAKQRAADRAETLRKTHVQDPSDRRGGYLPEGPEDRSLQDRCMQSVRMYEPSYYNNNYQIVQSPGYVVILHEWFHDARVIPTDGRPHVSPQIHQLSGNSRGHWEGNTLVVETANFADESSFRGANPRTLRLIERFARVSSDTLDYRFTADDPQTWVKPWTVAIPFTKDDTLEQIFEYACHEGNYSLANILSGARAVEKNHVAKNATRK